MGDGGDGSGGGIVSATATISSFFTDTIGKRFRRWFDALRSPDGSNGPEPEKGGLPGPVSNDDRRPNS